MGHGARGQEWCWWLPPDGEGVWPCGRRLWGHCGTCCTHRGWHSWGVANGASDGVLVPCHCGCIWWHGVWVTGTEHVSGAALISPQQRGDGNASGTQSPASPGLGDVLWGRLFLAPCAAGR